MCSWCPSSAYSYLMPSVLKTGSGLTMTLATERPGYRMHELQSIVYKPRCSSPKCMFLYACQDDKSIQCDKNSTKIVHHHTVISSLFQLIPHRSKQWLLYSNINYNRTKITQDQLSEFSSFNSFAVSLAFLDTTWLEAV